MQSIRPSSLPSLPSPSVPRRPFGVAVCRAAPCGPLAVAVAVCRARTWVVFKKRLFTEGPHEMGSVEDRPHRSRPGTPAPAGFARTWRQAGSTGLPWAGLGMRLLRSRPLVRPLLWVIVLCAGRRVGVAVEVVAVWWGMPHHTARTSGAGRACPSCLGKAITDCPPAPASCAQRPMTQLPACRQGHHRRAAAQERVRRRMHNSCMR